MAFTQYELMDANKLFQLQQLMRGVQISLLDMGICIDSSSNTVYTVLTNQHTQSTQLIDSLINSESTTMNPENVYFTLLSIQLSFNFTVLFATDSQLFLTQNSPLLYIALILKKGKYTTVRSTSPASTTKFTRISPCRFGTSWSIPSPTISCTSISYY